MNRFENPSFEKAEEPPEMAGQENIEAKREQEASSSKKEKGPTASIEKAEQVMGDRFYGPKRVEEAFDIKVERVPDIPYNLETLKEAAELGASLILRVDSDQHGNPLTIKSMKMRHKIRNNIEGGEIIDVEQEPFFTKDHPKLEWKIVIENYIFAQGKNYFASTLLIYKFIKAIGALSEKEKKDFPTEEKLTEFLDGLSKQVVFDWKGGNGYGGNNNWREISKKLANLEINKNHRRKAVESFYDRILKTETSNEKIRINDYDSTCTLSSDNRLVLANFNGVKNFLREGPHPGYEFLFYSTAVQY
jgi:hypothetical protein